MIAVMMVPVPRVIVTIVIRAATGKHKKEEAGKSPKHCAEANEKLDVWEGEHNAYGTLPLLIAQPERSVFFVQKQGGCGAGS